MAELPDSFRAILDGHVVVHLATINPDGSPQVSPVWLEREGDVVRFGSAEGRIKVRNLRRDNRLALSFTDPARPSVGFSMRGRAVSIEHRGWTLIDRLARAYDGSDGLPRVEGVVRVDVEAAIDGTFTNH